MVDLPIRNGDFSSFFVNVYQRVMVERSILEQSIIIMGHLE